MYESVNGYNNLLVDIRYALYLYIFSDTLLYDDFSLKTYIEKFNSYKKTDEDASMLLYVTCTDDGG